MSLQLLRQEIVLRWPKVQMALQYHEVMINLDQNPVIMEHMGVHMPVILASISNMHLGQSSALALHFRGLL